MATKPTLTVPDFATGNFGAGSELWSSQPRRVATNLASWAAAGYTPEEPTINESLNEYLARIADWCQWVELGSTEDDEDAHVVETDASGELEVARAVIGAHSVAGPSLTIAASASGVSLAVTGPGGAQFGATVSNSGTAAALRASHTGSGPALEGLNLGTGIGVVGSGAFGVEGSSSDAAGIGVRGVATGTATGVWGTATDGYGVIAQTDTSSPVRTALRLVPQDADASSPQKGDVYYNSADNIAKAYNGSAWRRLHQSFRGYFHVADGDTGNNTITPGGGAEELAACAIDPAAAGCDTGVVIVRASIEIVSWTADTDYADFYLVDDDGSPAEITNTRRRIQARTDTGGGDRKETVTLIWRWTLPSSGSRTIELWCEAQSGDITVDDLVLEVQGVIES